AVVGESAADPAVAAAAEATAIEEEVLIDDFVLVGSDPHVAIERRIVPNPDRAIDADLVRAVPPVAELAANLADVEVLIEIVVQPIDGDARFAAAAAGAMEDAAGQEKLISVIVDQPAIVEIALRGFEADLGAKLPGAPQRKSIIHAFLKSKVAVDAQIDR